MADEAVGLAWSRLNQQKRDFFTRYATTVSGALNQMQSEHSSLTTNLLDLYGQDAQYALENPILPGGGGAAGGGTNPDGSPAAPTTPGGSGNVARNRILWTGQKKPGAGGLGLIANRNRSQVPDLNYGNTALGVRDLQVKKRGGGKGYVVVRR
jgi:hypothetical protein